MTIDALPGKARRSRNRKTAPDSIAIGVADANIVACPSCARPLDAGTSKCPGCGTRMIAGVRATRALGFAASGLLVGLIIGTSVTGAVALLTRPSVVPAPASATTPIASTTPLASSVAPAASAPAPVVDPSIPTAAVSAIRQAAELNQRLTADAARLTALLAASSPSSADLARVLRALNANAAVGERLAPQVATWTRSAGLSEALAALYVEVGATARDGLAASLQNDDAYVATSERMLVLLDGLTAIDAQARPLAQQAGLELAPLVP
jgi:hypothetical protein